MKNYKTKNESFIKVSERLRNSGVKNYDFMLEIHDTSLLGIDPHNPSLDNITKEKIKTEIKNNIWYYFREYHQIPIIGSDQLQSFKLTKLTATMIYLFDKSRHQYVVAHRQSYKFNTAELLKLYGEIINRKVEHISNAEFVSNICNKFVDLYTYPVGEYDPLIIMESVINDNDDNRHSKLRNFAEVWTDKCFDIPEDELEDFYYIFYDYKELVDHPEKFFREMEIVLHRDWETIRREVLCLRIN